MGQYKFSFNWNVFSGLYYIIPILQRFLTGILITGGNASFASGIIAVLVFLTAIIIVIVKKPFIYKYQNYRSIITNIYSILILGIYIGLSIYGPSRGESLFTYAPYGIVVILSINILTGLVFIIVSFYNNIKNGNIKKKN